MNYRKMKWVDEWKNISSICLDVINSRCEDKKWNESEKKFVQISWSSLLLICFFFSSSSSLLLLYTCSSLINVHNISLKFYTYARMKFLLRISTLCFKTECCMETRYASIFTEYFGIGNTNRTWFIPCDGWLQTEPLFHFVWIKRVKIFWSMLYFAVERTSCCLYTQHSWLAWHDMVIPLALSNCYTLYVVGVQAQAYDQHDGGWIIL